MRLIPVAVTAACLAGSLSACGSSDHEAPTPATAATTTTRSTDGMSMDTSGGREMAGMKVLADSKQGDLDVELHAMPPETFYVSEGDGLRKQTPAPGDDVHLMVTVADAQSGVRLPDGTVTARITDAAGKTAFEGPLYPMVGRGMGLHYGENVDVGEKGAYTVTMTVGPPRIGRHSSVATAWNKTTKVVQKVRFDGKSFGPA